MKRGEISCKCPNHDCGEVCKQMVAVAKYLAEDGQRKECALRAQAKKAGNQDSGRTNFFINSREKFAPAIRRLLIN